MRTPDQFSRTAIASRLRLLAVPLVLLLGACNQQSESHQAAMDRAAQQEKQGNYKKAIASYETALDGTKATAEAHYRLGILYDDKLRDPVAALHHFRRYLTYENSGRRAEQVRRLARDAELKLQCTLADSGTVTQQEAVRLKNENLELRRQVASLRASTSKTPRPTGTAREPAQKPAPPGARIYEVQKGDTLAAISRRFYKTSARWKDIQDANFYALEGTVKLKEGMKLIIPE